MLGRLSALVTSNEAVLFQKFAGLIKDANQSHHWLDESQVLRVLERELCRALGSRVTVSIKGSMSKGTETNNSDVDILIDTHGHQVSLEEKRAVVEHLRKTSTAYLMMHPSHIELKRLAIGCIIQGRNVDLVFSSTAEYGDLPVDLEPRKPAHEPRMTT